MKCLASWLYSAKSTGPGRPSSRSPPRWGLWLAVVVLGWPVSAEPSERVDTESCLFCHGTEEASQVEGGSLFVDPGEFTASSHAALDCLDCHVDAAEIPHPEPLAAVGEGICADCHAEAVAAIRTGIHRPTPGPGPQMPTCTGCHGPPHEIRPASDPASRVYHLNLPKTCASCHSSWGPDSGEAAVAPRVYESYLDSIHGHAVARNGLLVAANCSSCHGTHAIRATLDPASPVSRSRVTETCGTCHQGISAEYSQGRHGSLLREGNAEVPTCVECHSAHDICYVHSEECGLQVVTGCGNCHTESLHTYRDTLHGQVTALGFSAVARCSDCHGFHRVLQVSDPQSPVAPANLVATCRKCHPRANANFVLYDPHADPDNREKSPMLYYAALTMESLIIGVFAFFGLHTLLWFIRSLQERFRTEPPGSSPPHFRNRR